MTGAADTTAAALASPKAETSVRPEGVALVLRLSSCLLPGFDHTTSGGSFNRYEDQVIAEEQSLQADRMRGSTRIPVVGAVFWSPTGYLQLASRPTRRSHHNGLATKSDDRCLES